MLTTDQPTGLPLVGQQDGGLAIRQMFRDVKERMSTLSWAKDTPRKSMACRDCIEQKKAKPTVNVRSFRSWSSLREHLISHHGYDHREIPE